MKQESIQCTITFTYEKSNGIKTNQTTTWMLSTQDDPNEIFTEIQKKIIDKNNKTNYTFFEFTERWLKDYAELHLSKKTVDRYKKLLLRIYPILGDLLLTEIDPIDILNFNRNIEQNSINLRTGKPLAPKTIKNHYLLVSSILSTAVEWQFIKENPASRVRSPKANQKESSFLDEKETLQLLDLLKIEPLKYQTMINILIFTGLRRGELCGLEWKDIDFDKKTISIKRASLYTASDGIYTSIPKTKQSTRIITISDNLVNVLKHYQQWQGVEKEKCIDWQEHDRLFTQKNGNPISPDTVTKWFSKFIEKNNFKKVNLHCLRHTNATLLLANGVPLKNVSARLGHAQASTTLNIYTHAINSVDNVAARTLENLFDKKSNS